MPQLQWSQRALIDIDRLVSFLEPKSAAAARRAYSAIVEAVEHLPDQPAIGRPMHEISSRHRELLVPFSSSGYRVLYLETDPIEILAVLHMREAGY